MESEAKKPQRSLKDISYLFLSSIEERKPNSGIPLHLYACLDSEKECSFEANFSFARALEGQRAKIVLLDFHHFQQTAEILSSRFNRSLEFNFLESSSQWKEVLQDSEIRTTFYLIDIPWYSPVILESVVRALSGLILIIRPSISSLKSAYRFLKSSIRFLPEDTFAKWDEKFEAADVLASRWGELVQRFLGRNIVWMGNFENILERRNTVSKPLGSSHEGPEMHSAMPVKGPRDAQGLEKEKFSLPHTSDPLSVDLLKSSFLSESFFESGRLSDEEIRAFALLSEQIHFLQR